MNTHRRIIIFSGYNTRAIIAFIRTLEKHSIEYCIIAKSDQDDIMYTRYRDRVCAIRTKTALDLGDLTASINTISQRFQPAHEFVIAPSTEALNRFILTHQKHFENLHCIFPTVGKPLYELISDKYSFGQLCKKHHISIPKEFNTFETAQPPFVAKPIRYVSSSGKIESPQIIKTKKDLNQFIKNHETADFYYQEFIDGQSFYLLYYFFKDGSILKYSQENLLQQENGKSILIAQSSDIHTHEISTHFERLFNSTGFYGLVMIEIKLHNNIAYMIEANPRFWGPSQLFIDADVNFFEALLYDFGLLPDKPNTSIAKKAFYFWDDGISVNYQSRNDVAYYNYSKIQFKKNRDFLQKIEIFNKNDTFHLYQKAHNR